MDDTPNRILEFLTATAKPTGDACRSNPRRRSSARVEFAWLDGAEWRTFRARLRDISRGGASLWTRSKPALDRRARLRVIGKEESPWIEAKVLDIEPDSPTRNRVRIQFSDTCPNLLLRLAVLGHIEPGEYPGVRHEWAAWKSMVVD